MNETLSSTPFVRPRLLVSVGVLAMLACSGGSGHGESLGSSASSIINGSPATAYPESVLLDMPVSSSEDLACSGVVIAPQVVLTAGHCVSGESGLKPTYWNVTAPYASNQKVTTTSAAVYDWVYQASGDVPPGLHDIGLLFLPTPIHLTAYPPLAKSPLPNGAQVVNIGRIDNGTVSFTDLYASPDVTVSGGSTVGFAYDYESTDEIQPGDSGGPDEVPSSHLVVAVNSGVATTGNIELLARVDLLYSWIAQQVMSHGGFAPTPDAGEPSPDAGEPSPDAGRTDAGGPNSDGGTHPPSLEGGALGDGGSVVESGPFGGGTLVQDAATEASGDGASPSSSGCSASARRAPGTHHVPGAALALVVFPLIRRRKRSRV